MKHGEEIAFSEDDGDIELWWGLATPMELREPCECQALCRCDDWKEALPGGKNPCPT